MQCLKVFAVARFEFLSVVRRWSFLVVTVLMPLFLGAGVLGVGGLQSEAFSRRANVATTYALVDEGRALGEFSQERDSQIRFVRLNTEREARAALQAGSLSGFFVLPAEYRRDGRVQLVMLGADPLDELSTRVAEARLADLLRAQLLKDRLEPELEALVIHPLRVERRTLSPTGVSGTEAVDSGTELAKLAVPMLVAFLLMLALIGTSSYLLQGLGAERENKVIEVLLACARADEIFLGKLFGLGAAGFVQFAVWVSLLLVGLSVAVFSLGLGAFEVPWRALFIGGAFVPLGYFFIGSLMLTTGSLGSNVRESQQYAMIWASPLVLPMTLLGSVLSEPDGRLATFLSWFPFTSPVALVLRLSLKNAHVSLWDVLGAAGVLLLCTWVSVTLGARLFRAGLLMSGSAFSFRSFLKKTSLK